jgi:hypothetical protein
VDDQEGREMKTDEEQPKVDEDEEGKKATTK